MCPLWCLVSFRAQARQNQERAHDTSTQNRVCGRKKHPCKGAFLLCVLQARGCEYKINPPSVEGKVSLFHLKSQSNTWMNLQDLWHYNLSWSSMKVNLEAVHSAHILRSQTGDILCPKVQKWSMQYSFIFMDSACFDGGEGIDVLFLRNHIRHKHV